MPRKSYKREAATAFMGLNLALFLYAVGLGPGPSGEWVLAIAKFLFVPYAIGVFGAAFFAEWLSTQSPWRKE